MADRGRPRKGPRIPVQLDTLADLVEIEAAAREDKVSRNEMVRRLIRDGLIVRATRRAARGQGAS